MKILGISPHPIGEIIFGAVFATLGAVLGIGLGVRGHFIPGLAAVPPWVIGLALIVIGLVLVVQGVGTLIVRGRKRG